MKRYFVNVSTLEELKKEYRRLAMQNHPDRGGDEQTMKEINAEYKALFQQLKDKHNATADEAHKTTETSEEFREVIDFLMNLDGITAELCGAWVWVSGDTRRWKEELKAHGFKWSSNKKMWHWQHEEDGSRWFKGKRTMSEIREKYGSQVFDRAGANTDYIKIGAAC